MKNLFKFYSILFLAYCLKAWDLSSVYLSQFQEVSQFNTLNHWYVWASIWTGQDYGCFLLFVKILEH